jgi:hypothetical protein
MNQWKQWTTISAVLLLGFAVGRWTHSSGTKSDRFKLVEGTVLDSRTGQLCDPDSPEFHRDESVDKPSSGSISKLINPGTDNDPIPEGAIIRPITPSDSKGSSLPACIDLYRKY